MKSIYKKLRIAVTLVAVGATFSGCIAAIPMVMMAATAGAVAAAGFAVYKTAQTASGGQVRIEFNSTDSKKTAPPPPLPAGAATVFVYGGGVRERTLVAGLKASGKFRTVAGGDSGDLAGMNSADQEKALAGSCRGRTYDLVLAAVDIGQSTQSNMLSFKKANTTERVSLEAYDCRASKVAWTDLMNVVNESSKEIPKSEIDTVAGQAWSERVVQAKG